MESWEGPGNKARKQASDGKLESLVLFMLLLANMAMSSACSKDG